MENLLCWRQPNVYVSPGSSGYSTGSNLHPRTEDEKSEAEKAEHPEAEKCSQQQGASVGEQPTMYVENDGAGCQDGFINSSIVRVGPQSVHSEVASGSSVGRDWVDCFHNGATDGQDVVKEQVAVGKRPALTIFGNDYSTKDGTGVRDYIHVVDLSVGHIAAVNKLYDSNIDTWELFELLAYNLCLMEHAAKYSLGNGKETSVLEMVSAFEKFLGKEEILIAIKAPHGRTLEVQDFDGCIRRKSYTELKTENLGFIILLVVLILELIY